MKIKKLNCTRLASLLIIMCRVVANLSEFELKVAYKRVWNVDFILQVAVLHDVFGWRGEMNRSFEDLTFDDRLETFTSVR